MGPVDSLCTVMRVLRGRLVVLSKRVARVEVWVRRRGAPEPEVNDEDERHDLICDLMYKLVESARLLADLHHANFTSTT